MFMNNVFTSFVALFCANFSLVNALAIAHRDVFDPPITYPTAGTVWHVGESHNVTWNTSILPPGFNGTGMIVLGFLDNSGDGNEHLDLANPLAKGFELIAGRADIIVPSVTTRDTYILVLFGDSGNASPTFTISNLTIGTPPSSSSTSSGSAGATTASPVGTGTSAVPSGASSGPDPATTSESIPSGSVSTTSAPPVFAGSANSTTTSASGLSSSSATATSPASAAASTGITHNAGTRATSLGGALIWLPIAIFLVYYV